MSGEGTEVGLCVLKRGVLRHYYEALGTSSLQAGMAYHQTLQNHKKLVKTKKCIHTA